ncbi:MAG: response regulator transcription factor [Flavobacteriales bacterium]|jgi:DNA-binding LytR/AlgR family response regulator|nr:response regulator transcription factor [Flavobacteriales bacterium]
MRTCIIIEDQPPAQRILKKYIQEIDTFELKGTFSNAIDALNFIKKTPVDLIFLDIHLPKISGIDFLQRISQSIPIILTTAFPDYAIKSYEFNVVDYLLKPFSFQRFTQALAKVPQENDVNTPKKSFYFKSRYDLIKLDEDHILYIKSDTDFTNIFTSEKKYYSNEILKQWLFKLGEAFCQVHKSYIVNTNHILKIRGNDIFLNDNSTIPIGRAYKEKFIKKYVRD